MQGSYKASEEITAIARSLTANEVSRALKMLARAAWSWSGYGTPADGDAAVVIDNAAPLGSCLCGSVAAAAA